MIGWGLRMTGYHQRDFLVTAKGMQERVVSFLPLSHVAGMMMDIVVPMVLAAKCPGCMTVFFARPYDLNGCGRPNSVRRPIRV
jgi:hypothetical protein